MPYRRFSPGLPVWVLVCTLSLPALAQPPAPRSSTPAASAQAAAGGDETVVAAREALRRKDGAALASARTAVLASSHPLAQWVDFWELQNRLPEAQQPELDAFFARWPGTYVEDRLRNDWLLELGKRRDWDHFRSELPRFRMNDDREVGCYALLTQQMAGQDVRAPALAAWYAQRDLDDGCMLLARTLFEAQQIGADEVWQDMRLSVEFNRPRAARAAAALLGPATERAVGELLDHPARYLSHRPATVAGERQLELLALMRLASSDPDAAATLLQDTWGQRLRARLAATAWAHVAKQAALKQSPQAAEHARVAWTLWDAAAKPGQAPGWSDDLLAWHVRAALRLPADDRQRWPLVRRAVEAMSASEQREAAWTYWGARAALALAATGHEGDAARTSAQAALEGLTPQLGFYGRLASEDLGRQTRLPAPAAAVTAAERDAVHSVPGFTRALQLISLGLRNEGVREWNYSLRGFGDRELLAAAQWACEREVWDRCISTSERTRGEVDIAQRFPLPLREQVAAAARAAGLEPALLYGLIRQESRFIVDARSAVGATGLMQLMPATARWTARKVGLEYRPQMLTDHGVNLQLGAAYLRRLVDDFDGSLALAAAAYNAGPGRPRRWREGPPVEAAAWAESIPFTETREYVKRVLTNSVIYAARLGLPMPALKSRLGGPVGPRDAAAPAPDRELP